MVTTGRKHSQHFYLNGIDKSYDEVFSVICNEMEITITDQRFIYFIDSDCVMDTTKGYRYENLTPAYEKVLRSGLNDLKYPKNEVTNKFCSSYNKVIDNLILLSQRIVDRLKSHSTSFAKKQIKWFENLPNKGAESFEEAIQRLLFINQIFWQTDHRLTGLGAWDTFLWEFYKKDKNEGRISKEQTLTILKDLFLTLHQNYGYKSNVLMGDTGQIFVLGRSSLEGEYISNDLTYLFIESLMLAKLPDPKILLRVNKNIPRKLMALALECISTGIGCPLFANDDVIIPMLVEFGVEREDALQYTTSACWEPLIGGKSTSLNNMSVLNYLRALDFLIRREKLPNITDFETFKKKYFEYLGRNLNAVMRVIQQPRFQYNPLLSVFTEGCYEQKKDVSWGGAKYKNVGITSVAMGNTVDALLKIKKFVFDEKKLTLLDVKQMLLSDFEGNELFKRYYIILKNSQQYFGCDEKDVIELVNEITAYTTKCTKSFRSYLGGCLKFGLSGSAYLDAAKGFPASIDGRKCGEPFRVHISNDRKQGFTELVNFAGSLDYSENRFNGNVVDFMTTPDFIKNNWEKFLDFLMISIQAGFFEMQINVTNSETLIEARKNPELYPNLIVRVWGFSAFFNDLPEEYKDVLIERAVKSEAG